jgi:hypothetical protein
MMTLWTLLEGDSVFLSIKNSNDSKSDVPALLPNVDPSAPNLYQDDLQHYFPTLRTVSLP